MLEKEVVAKEVAKEEAKEEAVARAPPNGLKD